jgi:hypothetical protein
MSFPCLPKRFSNGVGIVFGEDFRATIMLMARIAEHESNLQFTFLMPVSAKPTPTIDVPSSFGFQKTESGPRKKFTANLCGSKGKRFGRPPSKTCGQLLRPCGRWKMRPTRRPAAKKVKAAFFLPASPQAARASRPRCTARTTSHFLPSPHAAALAW